MSARSYMVYVWQGAAARAQHGSYCLLRFVLSKGAELPVCWATKPGEAALGVWSNNNQLEAGALQTSAGGVPGIWACGGLRN